MVRTSSAFVAALSLALTTAVNAYWLMGGDFITTERIDPIVNPGAVSGHVHSVVGGSNFGFEVTTNHLRQSQCTSVPIKEDKSNYWFPHLYFQWANGSFSSVNGGAVIYYLFPDKAGTTTPFPPDFRMISGNPRKRSYDANSYASQAIDFLCLDFNGQTTKHTGLPEKVCPSGIRSQVNFPSCWNGKDVDSPDHKSHVAYRSGGPDKGECTDPNFPVSIPRIFLEVYWGTGDFDKYRSQAMKPSQPFVFAYGDRTGYGNHADFYNGWEPEALKRAVDGCNCNMYGDPQCCADKGIFTLVKNQQCRITKQVDETTTGMLPKLPGNNPVQEGPGDATMMTSNVVPGKISPAYVYTGSHPTATGSVVVPATTVGGSTPPSSSAPVPSSSSAAPPPPSSSAEVSSSSVPQPSSSVSATGSSASPSSSAPVSTSPTPLPTTGNVAPTGKYPSGGEPSAPPASTVNNGEGSSPSSPAAPTGSGPVAPPASPPAGSPYPSTTAAPSVTTRAPVGGGATTVRTYISTRYTKPTGSCKPKKNNLHKNHSHKNGHNHYRRSSPLKRRYDFAVDDYYYLV